MLTHGQASAAGSQRSSWRLQLFLGLLAVFTFVVLLEIISAVTPFHVEQFPVLPSEAVFLPSSSIIIV